MNSGQKSESLVNERVLETCDTLKRRYADSGAGFDFAEWVR